MTTMLVCSNATPQAVDDRELAAAQLHAAGDLAAEHGFTLAYEALAWGTHVSRMTDAWDVVSRADHPGRDRGGRHLPPDGPGRRRLGARRHTGDRIGFLQVADAPVLSMDVLQWSRHHRVFPGQGSFDLAPVVARVVEAGYRGPLSLEVFSDVVREADPLTTSLDAMRSLLHLEEELRQHWSAVDPAEGVRRPRVELFDPPPAPDHVEVAFVEAAVRGAELDGLLAAMGFRVAGVHRTKPVMWWRHGGGARAAQRGQRPRGPLVAATTCAVGHRHRPRRRRRARLRRPARGHALAGPAAASRRRRSHPCGCRHPGRVSMSSSPAGRARATTGSTTSWRRRGRGDARQLGGGLARGRPHRVCRPVPAQRGRDLVPPHPVRDAAGLGLGVRRPPRPPAQPGHARARAAASGWCSTSPRVGRRPTTAPQGLNQVAFACTDVLAAAGPCAPAA